MKPFHKKYCISFPLTHSISSPDPIFLKRFTVWIQSNINKICHSPAPVQSKSSPMLISVTYSPKTELKITINCSPKTESKVAKKYKRKSSIPIQICLSKNDNIQINQYIEMSQVLNPNLSTCSSLVIFMYWECEIQRRRLHFLCCNQNTRAESAQNLTLWHQETLEITRGDYSVIVGSGHTYL